MKKMANVDTNTFLGMDKSYFGKKKKKKKPLWIYQNVLWNWYHQNALELLIDNIIGTSCMWLLKKNEEKLARFIDDILSLNTMYKKCNSKFCDFVILLITSIPLSLK